MAYLVILPLALKEIKEKNISFIYKDILYLFALGTLLIPLASTFNQIAIEHNSASFVAFVFSSNPFFIFLLPYIVLKERINIS